MGQPAESRAPMDCGSLLDVKVGLTVGIFLGLGNNAFGPSICLTIGMKRIQLSRAIMETQAGKSRSFSSSSGGPGSRFCPPQKLREGHSLDRESTLAPLVLRSQ